MPTITKEQKDAKLDSKTAQPKKLILGNDDYNSFDHVIDSLIAVCSHTVEQATQCAYIVHYKGECVVKLGDDESLTKMKEKLIFRGLCATLDNN